MSKEKIIRKGDVGSPERHARGELTKEVVNKMLVARVKKITSYHTLYRIKSISRDQFDAADKLRQHCELGRGIGSCEYREPIDGGGSMSQGERRLIYLDQYNKALKRLEPVARELVERVVIDDSSPTSRSMPSKKRREVMLLLRQSLDKLASYYGFS